MWHPLRTIFIDFVSKDRGDCRQGWPALEYKVKLCPSCDFFKSCSWVQVIVLNDCQLLGKLETHVFSFTSRHNSM
ncbi:hypothetical protein AC1031_021990 [Aphanomyces cochlioides]|nr:hypothetical protein AC1031_021990 [Aphanomyces cochlioides]